MERCRWCGASVSPKDVVCPSCGTRLRRESSTCPRCKKAIRSGLVVCPHCGEELRRRRIPWKLIGGFLGVVAAAAVLYLVLTMVPLPFGLPFVASAPTVTPTEIILPPTPTATATQRPPTSTPTSTATSTPVITTTLTPAVTVTATITVSATETVTATESPSPTETPAAMGTEQPGFLYPAPVLLAPADESELPADSSFNFTEGSLIELSWEPVGSLGENQYYSVSLVLTDRDGQPVEKVNWRKETTFVVPSDYHGEVGANREVYWSVTVISGTPGTGRSRVISPPSETWVFRWG
jgi:hypothetical protein